MHAQEPHSPGGRPRSSSDTYTTLPARVARQDRARLRRASDATPFTRGVAPPRFSQPGRAGSSDNRPQRHNAAKADHVGNRQPALDSLIDRRNPEPAIPPSIHESSTSRNRATFVNAYTSSRQSLQDTISNPTFSPVHDSYLPTYNHFGFDQQPPRDPQQLPVPTRFHGFFSRLAQEPPLPSLPSTPDDNSKNSFEGLPSERDGVRTSDEPDNEFDRDIFVRAMELDETMDGRSSLAVDVDIQPYAEQERDPEKSLFPKQTQSEGEGSQGRHLSYKERRKRGKHRIMYNKDSVVNQQRFIIILARALVAFGSPSHRVEPQLTSLASLFELPAQFVHTVGCVQICFGHPETRTSETLLVKADINLDLGRINDTHAVYRAVVRDEISASEGYSRLEEIIKRKPIYSKKLLFILTFVQGFIICGSSFGGSINDMWVAGLLSLLVSLAQIRASRSQLSSGGTDIFISGIVSLVSRVLSARVPGQIFCYRSISSASIAGLLPGSIMLAGVLDIASKNIHLGSSKVVSGLMTSLYLGFGLTLGSDIWLHFDKSERARVSSLADRFESFNGTFNSTNTTTPSWLSPTNLTGIWSFQETSVQETRETLAGCYRDPSWGWWFQPLPWYSLFALLPVLNLVLSMRRAQPLWTVEMPVMILISCASTAVTKVANRHMALSGHPDYTALLGSFVVSLLGNLYSRKMGGTAFTIMLTGIWLLIPTGLAQAGGLSSSYIAPGEDEYTESLDLARNMISVIIGVMSGVYLSARLVYAFGKKKNSAFVTF
ncbi:PRM10_3 [Sanghuangporus weigelae]